MKNYTFQEWSKARTISEGVDSEPQPGDFVISNPKAFMDSVVSKSGKLKNDGVANLRNFSRFKVSDVNGRKVNGSVSHRTYSGGHSKRFNSYDFLDVSPAFNAQGNKVWLNNAPGRRATAHYINKMYPIWAAKMGIEGFSTPDEQMAAQAASDEREMMQQMQEPEMQEPQYQQLQPQHQFQPQHQPQMQTQQQQPLPYRKVEPQVPYQQVQPRAQQAAPWQKPSQPSQPTYTMHNREVVPSSSGSQGSGSANFGFDSQDSYDQDSIPMSTNDISQDMGSFDSGDNMRLAASHDPSINTWKSNGDSKRYNYYPE